MLFCLSTAAWAADEHESNGIKIKMMEPERTETEAEQQLRRYLHTSYAGDESLDFGSGANLYGHQLIVSGDGIGEQQIYAVKELENLVILSLQTDEMKAVGLTKSMKYNQRQGLFKQISHQCLGLDLVKFLQLCGADADDEITVCFYAKGSDEPAAEISWQDLQAGGSDENNGWLLLLGEDEQPLTATADGPIKVLQIKNGKAKNKVAAVEQIILTTDENNENPDYKMHNREPYLQFADKTFTVEIYDKADPTKQVKSKTFTTKDLEDLAQSNPERVVANYYGMIGNGHNMNSVGLGGWLDYYTGLDLWWLLDTQVGLPGVSGYAHLVDRDGLVYGTIDDLRYLDRRGRDTELYTVTTNDGVNIPNAVPMIAFAKNGYPLLAEHDHTAQGYIDYNRLNKNLETQGVLTEVGVVKNHSGPFVACLGNLNGYYGGYQVETAGDCVAIRLYVDMPVVPADKTGEDSEDKEIIDYAITHNLLICNENGDFDSEADLTADELVIALGRLAGMSNDYMNCLNWAVEKKIINCDNIAVFSGSAAMSGAEVAQAVGRCLQFCGVAAYNDLTDKEMKKMLASDYIMPKKLQKADVINRGEAAQIFAEVLHYLQGY